MTGRSQFALCALLFGFFFSVGRFPDPRQNVGAVGVVFPLGDQLLQFGRILFRDVVEFGAVRVDVVEFPIAGGALCDGLPFSIPDGAVALVFPKKSDWFV